MDRGDEQTVPAGALWKTRIAAGTRVTLRNVGDEPLVLYRMTLTPDSTGTAAGTPVP
jgi:hypothetical protein